LCAILVVSSLAYLLARGDERRAGEPVRAPRWKERLPAILLAVATVGLLLAKSRTCVAGCLVACAVLIAFRVSGRTKATVGFFAAWAAVAGVFALGLSGVDIAAEAQAAFYMGRAEESEALSGRLPIWTELSNYVAERQWTGYGYAAFWTDDRIDTISRDIMWTFREAHSTTFEILLSVGCVGLLLYLVSVLVGATIAVRRALRGDPYAAYFLALMVFLAITAFTESSAVWPCLETTMLGTVLFQLALRKGEESRKSMTAVPAPTRAFPAGAPAS
jgi:O-antigen ligase